LKIEIPSKYISKVFDRSEVICLPSPEAGEIAKEVGFQIVKRGSKPTSEHWKQKGSDEFLKTSKKIVLA
jgi:hypothetical protein